MVSHCIVSFHGSYHIISYISWDHVIAHHNISSHSISSRIKPCHIIRIAIYYINSWSHHIKSYHIIFYIDSSPQIISCHLAWHHIIPCHIMSYHIIPYQNTDACKGYMCFSLHRIALSKNHLVSEPTTLEQKLATQKNKSKWVRSAARPDRVFYHLIRWQKHNAIKDPLCS